MITKCFCLMLSFAYYIRPPTLCAIINDNELDTILTEARADSFIQTFLRQKADINGSITLTQLTEVINSQDVYWDTEHFKEFINTHSKTRTLNEFIQLMKDYADNQNCPLPNERTNILYSQEPAVQEDNEKITEHLQEVIPTEQFQTSQSIKDISDDHNTIKQQPQVTASTEQFQQLQNVENPALPDEWMNLFNRAHSIPELFKGEKTIAEEPQMLVSMEQPQPTQNVMNPALPDEWMNLFNRAHSIPELFKGEKTIAEEPQMLVSMEQPQPTQNVMNPALPNEWMNLFNQEHSIQEVFEGDKMIAEEPEMLVSMEQSPPIQNVKATELSDEWLNMYDQDHTIQMSHEDNKKPSITISVPLEVEFFKEVDANTAEVISSKVSADPVGEQVSSVVPPKKSRRKTVPKSTVSEPNTSASEPNISQLPAKKQPKKRQEPSPMIDIPTLSENTSGIQAELSAYRTFEKTSPELGSENPKQKPLVNEQEGTISADPVGEHVSSVVPPKKSRRKTVPKSTVSEPNTSASEPNISQLPTKKQRKKRQEPSPMIDIPTLSENTSGIQAELSAYRTFGKTSPELGPENPKQRPLVNEQEGTSSLKSANTGYSLFKAYLSQLPLIQEGDAQFLPSPEFTSPSGIPPVVTNSLPSNTTFESDPRQSES